MVRRIGLIVSLLLLPLACGGGNEAIRRGVGAECGPTLACSEADQRCLTAFKGGYCGMSPCVHDTDCPTGSACVTESDGANYCFLICGDRPDCNRHRSVENESSCVSSLSFVDGAMGRKVCRPPLSGS